jgi:hypothetical protein
MAGARKMAGERAIVTVAMIKRAIRDRMCLSGTHAEFRVRFAPHALGRDENGRYAVLAFEYGGLTLGRTHWAHFVVDRLRRLQLTGDPWRTGSLESRPKFELTEIEAAIDASWMRTICRVDSGLNSACQLALPIHQLQKRN